MQKPLQKLRLGRLGRAAAEFWPFSVRVKVVGGAEMYVDLRSSIGRGLFATGKFDMAAIEPALAALGRGGTFIDVGANIGFYSLLASQRVGSTGRVHAFEIDPRPLHCLRKTVARFDLPNIDIIEAAVSSIDGYVWYQPQREHGHNRIDVSFKAGRKVRSIKLDTWVADVGLQRVDALKIDVEGAEFLVLDGSRATIARFKPIILCEIGSDGSVFGKTSVDIEQLLHSLDYSTEHLDHVHTPTILARPL